ncbi:hypothetical protein NBRC116589_18030 [Ruegeria sp. HU-ET01832]
MLDRVGLEPVFRCVVHQLPQRGAKLRISQFVRICDDGPNLPLNKLRARHYGFTIAVTQQPTGIQRGQSTIQKFAAGAQFLRHKRLGAPVRWITYWFFHPSISLTAASA